MATTPRADGGWEVVTDKGTIRCESVVNAAGLWGREVARLAGIELPLMPVEHHYLVTESVPEIEAMRKDKRVHHGRERRRLYSRQEGMGILLGAYEDRCTHWAVNGTPLDFDTELLPNNIECMAKNFEKAMQRMPCLGRVGIKTVINGPMIFSPDLAPLIGPHPDLRNYYCAAGVMTGFNQGAGVGRILAEWISKVSQVLMSACGMWRDMANGRTVDMRWNGRSCSMRTVTIGSIHTRNSARPGTCGSLKFTIAKGRLALCSAKTTAGRRHFGSRGKVMRARTSTHTAAATGTGLWERKRARPAAVRASSKPTFAKYRVKGQGAAQWLDRLLCNRIPKTVGRTVLSPMLSAKGRVIGDFTVSRLADQEFVLLGAGFMQEFHMRWFRQNLVEDVTPENVSLDYAGMHIAGPNRATSWLL